MPLNFKGVDYELFAFAFLRKNCMITFLSLYPESNLKHLDSKQKFPCSYRMLQDERFLETRDKTE